MIAPRFGFTRFTLPALAVLALFFAGARSPAQVRFEVRGESGVAGEAIETGLNQEFKAAIFIRNSGGASIQGFQMAITYDPTYLDFTAATWRGTALETQSLNSGNGPNDFGATEIAGGSLKFHSIFETTAPAPSFSLNAGTFNVGILTFKAIKITA